jgi:hypothetical protein
MKIPLISLFASILIFTGCGLSDQTMNKTQSWNIPLELTEAEQYTKEQISNSRYGLADGSVMPWSGAIMWPTDIGEQQILISCDEKDDTSNIEAIEQIVDNKTLGLFLEENCLGKSLSPAVKQVLLKKQFPLLIIDTHKSMYSTLAGWKDTDYLWISQLNTWEVNWVLPKTEAQKIILKKGTPQKIYTSDVTHLWRDPDDNINESISFLDMN